MNTPSIKHYGDNALLVSWSSDGYDPNVSDAVQNLCLALNAQEGWREIMPGYDCVVVQFDPLAQTVDDAATRLKKALDTIDRTEIKHGPIIDVPVHYGGEFGPDIDRIAAKARCSLETVIKRHSAQLYRVCFIGFIPGFAFMSAAPKSLHHPRHATPRKHVAAGSIGIAGWQTGIYGLDSPGGWQIIGRTDMAMFDANRDRPFTLQAGDRVRFVPQ